jgi:cell wall-associated NlpC family hydrolase
MKINSFLAMLASVLVLTSCSSVRKLSALDSPVTTTMVKKPRNTGQRQFLDMEMTPGGMKAQARPEFVSTKQTQAVKSVAVSYTEPVAAPGNVQIETANALQLKYAVVMDVTVEMLTNIPLLEAIDRWWGTKYCLGGITDSCIDCSGFTQNIMRDVYHQTLPRTALEQFSLAQKIELEDMKEGDLVFFNTVGKDISHVGVYLVNNKFVHASTSGGVTISDLNDVYWQPKFRGVGRISRELIISN